MADYDTNMKTTSLRFAILAATLTLCVMVQRPRPASAAACPPSSCAVVLADCAEQPCLFAGDTQVGTCSEGGATHKLLVVHCTCFTTECYE